MIEDDVIARALAEDVGDGDVTTAATVPEEARARALIRQKAPGVIYGLDVATEVFRALDPEMVVERLTPEGEWRDDGGPVLGLEGSARAILTGERTALNFCSAGGVTLDTLRDIASTGIDFVSVGALTHSAPALDLSLLLEPIS